MGRFKVIGPLIHNNHEFAIGAIIELSPEISTHLVEIRVLEPTSDQIPEGQKETIVEKFSAPSSVAEVEKAVQSNAMAPVKRGQCPKCKTEREIKNAQVLTSPKGSVQIIGECAICGTRISRYGGSAYRQKDKKQKKEKSVVLETVAPDTNIRPPTTLAPNV